MSHKVVVSAAEKKKYGVPTIKNLPALEAACVALGYKLTWTENYCIGQDRSTQKSVYVTGWSIKLPGWMKKTVYGKLASQVKAGERFDLTDEGVDEHFDNYPIYDGNHVEVKAGRKRAGEGDRGWGNITELWKLHGEYIKAANEMIKETVRKRAVKDGHSCTTKSVSADGKKAVMLIDTGSSKAVGQGGNPLDQTNNPALR